MIGKKPGSGPDNGEATSVIGENSVFEGNFEVNGNLRVDGKFSGELRVSETVQVGKNGFVDADVHTRNAVIAGTINRTASRRGATMKRTGLTDIVRSAVISSLTTIVAISAARAAPM